MAEIFILFIYVKKTYIPGGPKKKTQHKFI